MRGWGETDATSRAAFEEAVAAMARAGVAIIDRRGDPEVEALEREIVAGSEYSYDIFSWEARWPLQQLLRCPGSACPAIRPRIAACSVRLMWIQGCMQ